MAHEDDRWHSKLDRAIRTGRPLATDPALSDLVQRDLPESETLERMAKLPARFIREAIVRASEDSSPRGLSIRDFHIIGPLDLDGLVVDFPLAFQDCVFADAITANSTSLARLSLDSCRVASIRADGCVIQRDLLLIGCEVAGSLVASDATVSGRFVLDDSSVSGEVRLHGITVKGAFVARNGFEAMNGVQIIDGSFGRQVSFSGATVHTGPHGFALHLEMATIATSLFCNKGFTALGTVSLFNTTIGAEAFFDESTLTAVDRASLVLDGLSVGRDVNCVRMTATGAITGIAMRVAGALNLRAATLTSDDVVIRIDRARIDGAILLDRGFSATGSIMGFGMTVDGDVSLREATISHPSGRAVQFESASIRTLSFDEKTKIEGRIRLASATIGTLVVPRTPAELPGTLIASGWSVGQIEGFVLDKPEIMEAWLATAPTFSSQPWHEIAAIYDRNGHPDSAAHLRWRAAWLITRQAAGPLRRVGGTVYGAVAGHGYYPMLSLVWLVVIGLVSFVLVWTQASAFTPTDRENAVFIEPATGDPWEINGATSCALIPSAATYPCFSAAEYAVDVAVPITGNPQAEAWSPSKAPWIGWVLKAFHISSWILSAILLAGFTNLLRKT